MTDTAFTHKQILEQPYDPALVDNIKRILELQQKMSRPQSYEILVDGLRVVPRTVQVELFDSYKSFMNDATQKITVIVYRGIKTPACNTFVFIKEKSALSNTLSGIQDSVSSTLQLPSFLQGITFESRMQEMMDRRDMENENRQLKLSLEKHQQELKEAEQYISQLQEGIDSLKQDQDKKRSLLFERLLKLAENPPDWVKLWMVKAAKDSSSLSGTEQNQQQEEIINMKSDAIDQDDKRYLSVLRKMEEELEQGQLHTLMLINDKLIEQTDLIEQVADLVEIKK
jgi:hypothetical protein